MFYSLTFKTTYDNHMFCCQAQFSKLSQFCMSVKGWSYIILAAWVSDSLTLIAINLVIVSLVKNFKIYFVLSLNIGSNVFNTKSKLVVIICSF